MVSGQSLLRLSAVAGLGLLVARPVSAVIVNGTTGNQTAPASTPGFNNVGYVPYGGTDTGGSGVYLGDGWVLTAFHVQGGSNGGYSFVIPGQGTFLPEEGSQRRLHYNGYGSDVSLFRLTSNPALPNVQFGATPQVGSSIVMTGMGWNRETVLRHWLLGNPSDPENTTWTDVTGTGQQGAAQRRGYYYASGFARRWATNVTEALDVGNAPTTLAQNSLGKTVLFGARWDNLAGEGMVAPGDSGGGVWINNRLVGIGVYKGDESKDPSNPDAVGQPTNAAVYGNYAFFVNLASYVDEIASWTGLHPSIDGDANLDGLVDNADFKVLYDNFHTGTKWTEGDFSLDGVVDFTDFQLLEANFGKSVPIPGGVAAGGVGVPEPVGLAWVGLGGVVLLRRRGKKQQ